MSNHPPPIENVHLYLAYLDTPRSSGSILQATAAVVLRKKAFTPSLVELAKMCGVGVRQVSRYLQLLIERGWLRVKRRGKKLTNRYWLSRALFYRLTGQRPRPERGALQQWLANMGRRLGFAPGSTIGRGAATPVRVE